jgi:pimeloyl-ACP methyl ester carboxylesterase
LVKRTQHEAVIAASTAMMHRRDHRATVGTITQPMLWIIGKQDTFAPFAQIIQQSDTCKQAMVEVMDDVGHLCMYEDLAQTVHIVQRFLQWINQVSAGAETQ